MLSNKAHVVLVLIILFTFLTRIIRLDYPNAYVFDEVYHAFTAKEYLKGNKDAWNPFATPPKGVAYEWLHPPIAKEIMTLSMLILNNTNAWAWRLPGVIMGVLSVYLLYLLTKLFFKSEHLALIAAFLFSLEGLLFVQSRTGMNDIYLVTFILATLILLCKKKYLLSSLLLGIACATKWPGIFLIGPILIYLLKSNSFKKIPYFIIIPSIIYFSSYIPYFYQGFTLADFQELHRQIWWYQTNLKATHDYASPWWSWPLNLYPVWYYVDYQPDGKISNIFASGNPLIFISGIFALILTIKDIIFKRSFNIMFITLCYFVFLLPWSMSPRIMFLYHYSPSIPFLVIILAYQLYQNYKDKQNKYLLAILFLYLLSFIMLFPILTGIPISKNLLYFFFQTNLTKNPF